MAAQFAENAATGNPCTHAQSRARKYAAIKKRNSALDQSTYPDGFTVDVKVSDKEDASLSLPLSFHASLESDPKAVESPPEVQLSSRMDAIVDLDGKVVVRDFRME